MFINDNYGRTVGIILCVIPLVSLPVSIQYKGVLRAISAGLFSSSLLLWFGVFILDRFYEYHDRTRRESIKQHTIQLLAMHLCSIVSDAERYFRTD